jgi:Protein of unknown function (DUF2274)
MSRWPRPARGADSNGSLSTFEPVSRLAATGNSAGKRFGRTRDRAAGFGETDPLRAMEAATSRVSGHPAELIVPMIERFMATDTAFAKARRGLLLKPPLAPLRDREPNGSCLRPTPSLRAEGPRVRS